jgi:hypothetical protein
MGSNVKVNIKNMTIIYSIILLLVSTAITSHVVMAFKETATSRQDGYNRGYNDALCDLQSCHGHGIEPSCPSGHTNTFCNGYADGYATAQASNKNNNLSPRDNGEQSNGGNRGLGESVNPGMNDQSVGGQPSSGRESSAVYYQGMDWWSICNNSLVRSYISQPCETLVSPDHQALTSQGKTVLEGILCPKGPSILSTLELFYGHIPDRAKNELSIACGWQ